MTRGVARMLAVAALFLVALPARAVADRSFTTTGSITITWQGDPARGCAAAGLCGVQGALSLQSAGGSSSTSGGPPGGGIDVPIETLGTTVRVSDGPGAGNCIDSAGMPGGGDLLLVRRAGGRQVGVIQAGLSSGRCAGPREQDLAGLALPVRRSGGKLPTYDMRTSQSFAAGPFSGRLVSTLVVRSIPNAPGSGSVTSGSVPVAPAAHKVFLEQVLLRYRLGSLPSALDVGFVGEPDPFCAALDSCGASGTLAFALPGLRQSFEVEASRQVNRRVDARQALADFRRGRLSLGGGVAQQAGAGGIADVTETYAGSGGLRCQSTSESPDQPQLLVEPRSARTGGGVAVLLNDQIGSDLLRTYCPGPSVTDVFGSNSGVARASIGVSQLLARHSAISLSAPGSFAGTGYVGTRGGALRFSLTLEHVRAGTVEVTRP